MNLVSLDQLTRPWRARRTPSARGDERFEYSPFPSSWFQVAWSDELAPGQVKALRCFGRELVLFRGHDGRARLLDAYCPHLGAHLGVGGTVVGDELRCPFHGWRFDGTGACTGIDYARKLPPKARLGAWPVDEKNGMILAWHGVDGHGPWFEVPLVPEYGAHGWSRPRHFRFTIRTRWREILENAVDRGHFDVVHRYPEPPVLDFRADGHRFHMTSKVRWRRLGFEMDARLDIEAHGAGFSIARGNGGLDYMVLASTMPVDADSVVQRMTFMVSKKVPRLVRGLAIRLVMAEAMAEFRRDIPIWEHKIGRERPMLCDGDGPIGRFRSWAAQF